MYKPICLPTIHWYFSSPLGSLKLLPSVNSCNLDCLDSILIWKANQCQHLWGCRLGALVSPVYKVITWSIIKLSFVCIKSWFINLIANWQCHFRSSISLDYQCLWSEINFTSQLILLFLPENLASRIQPRDNLHRKSCTNARLLQINMSTG